MNTFTLSVPDSYVHIGGYTHVESEDILFCQSDSNYTHVHFVKQRKITVATTLGILEGKLNTRGFVRVNRSELVNTSFIESYDGYQITLINGTILPIARRRRKEIQQQLGAYFDYQPFQKLRYA